LLAGARETAPQQSWHVQQTSACAGCTQPKHQGEPHPPLSGAQAGEPKLWPTVASGPLAATTQQTLGVGSASWRRESRAAGQLQPGTPATTALESQRPQPHRLAPQQPTVMMHSCTTRARVTAADDNP
jgi:hypothetical protein